MIWKNIYTSKYFPIFILNVWKAIDIFQGSLQVLIWICTMNSLVRNIKKQGLKKNNNTFNYLVKRNYTLILLLWLDSKIKHKLNNNKTQTSELLCFEMILTAWSVNISVEYFPNWSTTDFMLWWKSNPHISPYQRE